MKERNSRTGVIPVIASISLMILFLFTANGLGQTIDSSRAIELAYEYTALDQLNDSVPPIGHAEATLVTVEADDLLPFAKNEGLTDAWKVSFSDVVLWPKGPCSSPQTFHVYLSKYYGRFLWAVRFSDEANESEEAIGEAISACTPGLIHSSLWEFVDYVRSPVDNPLSSALFEAAFSYPCKSTAVYAYLLRLRDRDEHVFNAWLVIGVDNPGQPQSGMRRPQEDSVQTWTSIVDADANRLKLAAELNIEACMAEKE